MDWVKLNENKYPVLRSIFAIPNGGSRGSTKLARMRAGKRLKDEGVRAGVPDLLLPAGRLGYNGLFLEMKFKDGTLSKAQKEFCKLLTEQNYLVLVPYTWQQAAIALEAYINENEQGLSALLLSRSAYLAN